MNAQEYWKFLYQDRHSLNYAWYLDRRRGLRREAALERRLAAAQRTIEAQAAELNHYHRLQADIDMGVIELVMPGEVSEVIDPDELRTT